MSTKYTLNTSFSQEDLRIMRMVGSNVVVAKPSDDPSQPNVAWVVFHPLESNKLEWEEEYGIYASNTELTNGALITQLSRSAFPAQDGKVYEFTPSGFFGPPSSGGTLGSFTSINAYKDPYTNKGYLTFGLFQDANINSVHAQALPVSAALVPYQQKIVMTPYTTIYLWLQAQVQSSSVLSTITSPMTKVRFGGGVTDISLAYDAESGKFITKANAALPQGVALDYMLPSLV
ncbi:MAG TPA: hypothetical protein VG147_06660 [Solirubrobacteraceae bacterium]|jgi:hypothetical protein|nr:hypothetical protein [Solirubrobacteraceae bacterium]